MSYKQFFIVENDLPYLSPEARNLVMFNDILKRDKGDVKKVDGETKRVKTTAQKEIAFIYFYLDTTSFSNYNDKERKVKIKTKVGISWDLDDLVWKAIEELKDDDKLLEEKLLDDIDDNMETYRILLKSIKKNNEAAISVLEENLDSLDENQITERNKLIEKARADFKWCFETTNSLAATFKTIENLRAAKDVKNRNREKSGNRLEDDFSIYKKRTKN